jgi:DNA-binding NarL/FixJ family response regulator
MTDLQDTVGLAQARQLRKKLGGGSTEVLTPREVEVLGLVSRGLTNEQIAQTLHVSQHTVHRHVANILTRLDQPTRAAAVSVAMATGIL